VCLRALSTDVMSCFGCFGRADEAPNSSNESNPLRKLRVLGVSARSSLMMDGSSIGLGAPPFDLTRRTDIA